MGQTSSHKHLRNDFLKNAHITPQTGNIGHPEYNPSIEYSGFQQDDVLEDEEVSCPTINSRNSYVKIHSSHFTILKSIRFIEYFSSLTKSPSDSIPIFKFPNSSSNQSANNRVEHINRKLPVVFNYSGKIAKEVFLIGTFTNWKDKIQMIKRYNLALKHVHLISLSKYN